MLCSLYEDDDAPAYDDFVCDSASGTFLHSRKFLGYHKQRFIDKSVLVRQKNGKIIAVMSAAVVPDDPRIVCTHPGSSFGGILLHASHNQYHFIQIFSEICNYYKSIGFRQLIYKSVPSIYHKTPQQIDSYVFHLFGGYRSQCHLSSTIDNAQIRNIAVRRKRCLRKAVTNNLKVDENIDDISQVHQLISECLKKFNVQPVHSEVELLLLKKLFPSNVRIFSLKKQNQVVAACVFFVHKMVIHVQYVASNSEGKKMGAVDLLIEHGIKMSVDLGIRFFDFGVSTENCGKELNSGLLQFKSEFGSGTTVTEQFKLNL